MTTKKGEYISERRVRATASNMRARCPHKDIKNTNQKLINGWKK